MKSISLVKLGYFNEIEGDLVVAEGNSDDVPFSIARVFNVRADKGGIRGRHAHHKCSQLLICANGVIKVTCDDGNETSEYILDKANHGLLIEPLIWVELEYLKENTVLTVLCNFPFDEADYIRNYKDFLKLKYD